MGPRYGMCEFMASGASCRTCRPALNDVLPSTCRPFSRKQADAVALATHFDLCIGGEALHHIQQIGAEALFIPLTQVRPSAAAVMRTSICRHVAVEHIQTPVMGARDPLELCCVAWKA